MRAFYLVRKFSYECSIIVGCSVSTVRPERNINKSETEHALYTDNIFINLTMKE
jgi:hypothetical protein